jgi:hypothetical protein
MTLTALIERPAVQADPADPMDDREHVAILGEE